MFVACGMFVGGMWHAIKLHYYLSVVHTMLFQSHEQVMHPQAKESQPAESKESQPAESKESQPAESRESQPAESKESQPAESKESQPAESNDSHKLDHPYDTTESPRKLKRKLNDALETVATYKKKLKVSLNKRYRLKKKVSSLNAIITSLRDSHLVSNECADLLEKSISGAPLDLMKRITYQNSGRKPGSYSPELRSFAMTLKFYSAKAYRYVRKSFNLGLPHPSVIRGWYSAIDAEPGFTAPAFSALAAKVLAAKRDGNEILCSLSIDEMAIKKHIEWDGKRFRGFVDVGTGVDDDSLPAAKDALVFMVVCINGSWKVPVGYFLIDGLSGVEKANLVSNCLERLYHVGVKVISFTCDGPSSHITMLRHLGAQLDDSALEPSFPHPSDPSVKVNVFLDVCHMLKLVRNTFADGNILIDGEGGTINWKHIVDLHSLQENEGLRLANKLKSSHISWERQKMKVNLAAQCISSSVADALDFCCSHLKLAQFQDSQATSKFLRIFDRLFDILNSRNPFANNFKAPLRRSNFGYIDNFLTMAFSYIMELKDKAGKRVLESRRKTGFLGLLIAIRSLQAMYYMHVSPSNSHLKYIISYKMSQDHLELFFAAVRSSGGSNNNPTSRQFTSAYKQASY